MRTLAAIAAMLSVCWTLPHLWREDGPWFLGASIGALLLFNSWWEHRKERRPDGWVARPLTSYFAATAMLVWAVLLWLRPSTTWAPFAFALAAIVVTASNYVVRVPEWPLLGQSFIVAGQCRWLAQTLQNPHAMPWYISLTVIATTVLLSHWWQRQRRLDTSNEVRNFFQVLYAGAVVAIAFFWLEPRFTPSSWLAVANLLAIAVTLYAVLTRSWILAAFAQAFLLVGSWEFARQLIKGKPAWYLALAPVATWFLLGLMTATWLARRPGVPDNVRHPLFQASVLYRWIAFGMSLWWVQTYFAARNYFWILCAAGVLLIALGAWRQSRQALRFGAAYLAFAVPVFVVQLLARSPVIHWANALALLALMFVQQAVRRLPQRIPVPANMHEAVIIALGTTLLLLVSRWVVTQSGGAHFFLTASWAALAFALFSGGFLLRERMYRWLGLGVLACAVGRVFLFDVWRLEMIYRILSFMVLGIVLLVLGFIYNKYQEKIRQWL